MSACKFRINGRESPYFMVDEIETIRRCIKDRGPRVSINTVETIELSPGEGLVLYEEIAWRMVHPDSRRPALGEDPDDVKFSRATQRLYPWLRATLLEEASRALSN